MGLFRRRRLCTLHFLIARPRSGAIRLVSASKCEAGFHIPVAEFRRNLVLCNTCADSGTKLVHTCTVSRQSCFGISLNGRFATTILEKLYLLRPTTALPFINTYSIQPLSHKADPGLSHIQYAKYPSRRHSLLYPTSKCSHVPTSGALHWQLHRLCARSERSPPQRWEVFSLHNQWPHQHRNCPLHDRTLDLPMPSTPEML